MQPTIRRLGWRLEQKDDSASSGYIRQQGWILQVDRRWTIPHSQHFAALLQLAGWPGLAGCRAIPRLLVLVNFLGLAEQFQALERGQEGRVTWEHLVATPRLILKLHLKESKKIKNEENMLNLVLLQKGKQE